jgi:cyclophilin family peptidyl-prolyl cis-trans isomerase
MKYGLTLFTLLLSAVLIGAGCSPADSPVSLDKYQVTEEPNNQSITPPVNDTGVESPVSVSSTEEATDGQVAGVAEENPSQESLIQSTTTKPEQTPMSPEPQAPEKLAFPGILPAEKTAKKQVRIKTTKGDIVFELLPDQGPKAASNFVYLTERGFYDNLTFHRVVPGFVIQGGDPAGNGTGGPGYRFEDDPVSLPYKEGIVAMANAGKNTNGSQFFIMLADNPLDPAYSIFGRVISGMDVVKKITVGDSMSAVSIEPIK